MVLVHNTKMKEKFSPIIIAEVKPRQGWVCTDVTLPWYIREEEAKALTLPTEPLLGSLLEDKPKKMTKKSKATPKTPKTSKTTTKPLFNDLPLFK